MDILAVFILGIFQSNVDIDPAIAADGHGIVHFEGSTVLNGLGHIEVQRCAALNLGSAVDDHDGIVHIQGAAGEFCGVVGMEAAVVQLDQAAGHLEVAFHIDGAVPGFHVGADPLDGCSFLVIAFKADTAAVGADGAAGEGGAAVIGDVQEGSILTAIVMGQCAAGIVQPGQFALVAVHIDAGTGDIGRQDDLAAADLHGGFVHIDHRAVSRSSVPVIHIDVQIAAADIQQAAVINVEGIIPVVGFAGLLIHQDAGTGIDVHIAAPLVELLVNTGVAIIIQFQEVQVYSCLVFHDDVHEVCQATVAAVEVVGLVIEDLRNLHGQGCTVADPQSGGVTALQTMHPGIVAIVPLVPAFHMEGHIDRICDDQIHIAHIRCVDAAVVAKVVFIFHIQGTAAADGNSQSLTVVIMEPQGYIAIAADVVIALKIQLEIGIGQVSTAFLPVFVIPAEVDIQSRQFCAVQGQGVVTQIIVDTLRQDGIGLVQVVAVFVIDVHHEPIELGIILIPFAIDTEGSIGLALVPDPGLAVDAPVPVMLIAVRIHQGCTDIQPQVAAHIRCHFFVDLELPDIVVILHADNGATELIGACPDTGFHPLQGHVVIGDDQEEGIFHVGTETDIPQPGVIAGHLVAVEAPVGIPLDIDREYIIDPGLGIPADILRHAQPCKGVDIFLVGPNLVAGDSFHFQVGTIVCHFIRRDGGTFPVCTVPMIVIEDHLSFRTGLHL